MNKHSPIKHSPIKTTQPLDTQPLKKADSTPWFIHVFLAITGLFSGLSVVGFLVLLLSDSIVKTSVQLIVGSILIAVSVGLFQKNKHGDGVFLDSLGFALSVAGQLFIIVAIFSYDDRYFFNIDKPILTFKILLLMLFQMMMLIAVPKFLHQLLNSLVILGSLVWLMNLHNAAEVTAGSLALITVVFGLQRFELVSLLHQRSYQTQAYLLEVSRTIAYASAIMLLIISVFIIAAEFGHGFMGSGSTQTAYHYSLAQGLLILPSLYAAYLLLKRYRIAITSGVGVIVCIAIIVLGMLSVYVSGLLATSLVIVIAFANRERILLAFGIMAQVSYIFWYYYQLDTSLLIKSISMLVVGIAVLGLRQLLKSAYFSRHLLSASADVDVKSNTDSGADSKQPYAAPTKTPVSDKGQNE